LEVQVDIDQPAELKQLLSSGILDSGSVEAFDRIAWLAAEVLNVPHVMISLKGCDKNWLFSTNVFDELEAQRALSLIEEQRTCLDIFELTDAHVDPDFFDLPSFNADNGLRFFATAPIKSLSGEVYGHVVLASSLPRQLTSKERNIFRCVADQVESELRVLILMQEEANLRFAAAKAFNTKSSFLSLISHEIRTPIAGIMGATDMLLAHAKKYQDILPAGNDHINSKDMLKMIWTSASDLLQLLNQTLDTAKIESDGVSIEDVCVDLVDFSEKLRRHFRPLAETKGLKLNVKLVGLDELGAQIYSDPTRLRQVVFNLMHNSMKFTNSGEVGCYLEMLPGSAYLHRLNVLARGCMVELG